VAGVLFGLALYNKAQAKEYCYYYYYKEKWQKKKLTASRRVNLAISKESTLWFLNHCSFHLGFRTKLN
jgi:hypothetical protein